MEGNHFATYLLFKIIYTSINKNVYRKMRGQYWYFREV